MWKNRVPENVVTLRCHPVGVMGTSCTLQITMRTKDAARAKRLFQKAEAVLRRCEALTSTWIETSEVSRFNRSKEGVDVVLSPFTMDFFLKAEEAFHATQGAFDISCGRCWTLWAEAEKKNQLPTRDALERAKNDSNWQNIKIERNCVRKLSPNVSVVTGGLAKGMAADAALEALRSEPEIVLSAVVEVGGDIAVWQNTQPIGVRHNDQKITLANGGICSSGHYARHFSIEGKSFSQILDPRTGQPVEKRWSVSVCAPDAATADLWATALEVLGTAGLNLLPDGVSAKFDEERNVSTEIWSQTDPRTPARETPRKTGIFRENEY
ncbi:MAG: FAD:protein FMN transferase [Planctomycetia bacterium]|nr:FAD:protein FMN transferase [Planctomycetia bacterium]